MNRQQRRRTGWPMPEEERHDNDPDPDRRLRIGYVSGDFRQHSAALAALRERMTASPVADTARYVRAFEAAYREMWGIWCAGQ